MLLIGLYLGALLRLPREQWLAFAWIAGGLLPLLFAAGARGLAEQAAGLRQHVERFQIG